MNKNQPAVKVTLGEAARNYVKSNTVGLNIVDTAKKIAIEANRKTVSVTDIKAAEARIHLPPPAAPTKKAKTDEAQAELNWAFRRLRRQALNYFGSGLKRDGLKENLKELREALESTEESYKALREKCERLTEDDNKLVGTWDSFMEDFFGHVIHPGSRSND